jgi:hypothetical protein
MNIPLEKFLAGYSFLCPFSFASIKSIYSPIDSSEILSNNVI